MLSVVYLPKFIKNYNNLEKALAEEVYEKIELFKDPANHNQLKVHKLHGKFSDRYSFSVNYKTRIIFRYISKKEVAFLTVGDHDEYK